MARRLAEPDAHIVAHRDPLVQTFPSTIRSHAGTGWRLTGASAPRSSHFFRTRLAARPGALAPIAARVARRRATAGAAASRAVRPHARTGRRLTRRRRGPVWSHTRTAGGLSGRWRRSGLVASRSRPVASARHVRTRRHVRLLDVNARDDGRDEGHRERAGGCSRLLGRPSGSCSGGAPVDRGVPDHLSPATPFGHRGVDTGRPAPVILACRQLGTVHITRLSVVQSSSTDRCPPIDHCLELRRHVGRIPTVGVIARMGVRASEAHPRRYRSVRSPVGEARRCILPAGEDISQLSVHGRTHRRLCRDVGHICIGLEETEGWTWGSNRNEGSASHRIVSRSADVHLSTSVGVLSLGKTLDFALSAARDR